MNFLSAKLMRLCASHNKAFHQATAFLADEPGGLLADGLEACDLGYFEYAMAVLLTGDGHDSEACAAYARARAHFEPYMHLTKRSEFTYGVDIDVLWLETTLMLAYGLGCAFGRRVEAIWCVEGAMSFARARCIPFRVRIASLASHEA
jgi:hypothetical protein